MDIDTTRPNSGRIYDYLLGGAHNFPADREAAENLVRAYPELPKWMRLNRWFLYHAVDQLVAGGFSCYIDLATGLPTQGYLHDRVTDDARIIYNDIDPVTVAFAQQIIGEKPNIRYVRSDIRDISNVLVAAEQLFGTERRVGICMVGVSYFLEDEAITTLMRQLYAWVAPGSLLALSHIDFDPAAAAEVVQIYQKMGTALYSRSEAHLFQLLHPWQVRPEGVRSLEAIATEQLGSPIELERMGQSAGMFGAIFEKR